MNSKMVQTKSTNKLSAAKNNCHLHLATINMVLWGRNSLRLTVVGKYKAPGVSTATFEFAKSSGGKWEFPSSNITSTFTQL